MSSDPNESVETRTSARGASIHIRVHVANQHGALAAGPFAPIVTLAFHNAQGTKEGELKLNFKRSSFAEGSNGTTATSLVGWPFGSSHQALWLVPRRTKQRGQRPALG